MATKKYISTVLRLICSLIILALLCKCWPSQTMVFIAFIAVTVALFKDNLLSYYLPPKLRISISDKLPHFREADSVEIKTGQPSKQAWLGVLIENTGISRAKNVSVYFNGLQSGSIKHFSSYSSLPLEGSHIKRTLISSIPPDIEIRFDLCFINHNNPQEINFSPEWTPKSLSNVTCTLEKICSFEFEIVAFADNASTVTQKVEMQYNGKYLNGLKIELINNPMSWIFLLTRKLC